EVDRGNYDRHLYDNNKYAHFSRIVREDFKEYPLLQYAKPIDIVMNAGDVLYIPKNWWHWVKSYGRTMAVNYWWDSDDGIILNQLMKTNKYPNREGKDTMIEVV